MVLHCVHCQLEYEGDYASIGIINYVTIHTIYLSSLITI